MMRKKIKYRFTSKPWRYSGKAGWFFLSMPRHLANEIRSHLRWQEEGWGRLKATARIGASTWDTAIWFDTKLDTYLLPLKLEIRKKENLGIEKDVIALVWI